MRHYFALLQALANLAQHHYVKCVERLPNDARYVFKSTAVSEVIYSLMLAEQRERLHAQIGEYYERACARRISAGLPVTGTELLAVLAHHFGCSGDAEKAVRYLVAAGHEAVAAGLYAEAEQRYLDALAVIDGEIDGDDGGGEKGGGSGGGEHRTEARYATDLVAHLLVSLAEISTRFGVASTEHGASPLMLFSRAEGCIAGHAMMHARIAAHIAHSRAWAWAKTLDSDITTTNAETIKAAFEEVILLRQNCGFQQDAAESLNGLACLLQRLAGMDTVQDAQQVLGRALVHIEQSIQLRAAQHNGSSTRASVLFGETCLGWSTTLAQSFCSLGLVQLQLAGLLDSSDKSARTDAVRAFERSVALYTTTLGSFHPRVARALDGLARAHAGLGRRAMAHGEWWLAKHIRSRLGPEHRTYIEACAKLDASEGALDVRTDAPWRAHTAEVASSAANAARAADAAARLCAAAINGDATSLDDATLEAQLREAYPELAYLAIGPRLHDDASLSDGLPKHERCVLAAMVLAVRLAAPDGARPPGGSTTVSGIDAAVHSVADVPAAADEAWRMLRSFSFSRAAITSACALDQLLCLLALGSLHCIANLVCDAGIVPSDIRPLSRAAPLVAGASPLLYDASDRGDDEREPASVARCALLLPTLERLALGKARDLIAALTPEYDLEAMCSGLLAATCLAPLTAFAIIPSTAQRLYAARLLCETLLFVGPVVLTHHAKPAGTTNTSGADRLSSAAQSTPAWGVPSMCDESMWLSFGATRVRRALKALEALASAVGVPLSGNEAGPETDFGRSAIMAAHSALNSYLASATATVSDTEMVGDEQVVNRRLLCLLGCTVDAQALADLRDASSRLRQLDWDTITQECTALDLSGGIEDQGLVPRVISLRNLSRLVTDCIASESNEAEPAAALSKAADSGQDDQLQSSDSGGGTKERADAITSALAVIARTLRVARDAMPSRAPLLFGRGDSMIGPRRLSRASSPTFGGGEDVSTRVPAPFRVNCAALARVAAEGASGLGSRTRVTVKRSSRGASVVVQPEEDSPAACFAAPFADRTLVSGDDAVGDGLTRLIKTLLQRGGKGGNKHNDGMTPVTQGIDAETRRKLGFLRAVKSLAFLGEEQLLQLAQQMKSKVFKQNDTIVAQGEVAEDFFVIQNGAARVYVADELLEPPPAGQDRTAKPNAINGGGSGRHVRDLGVGDYFGEIGLLSSDGLRTSTVVAITTSVKCWTLSRDQFIKLFGDDVDAIEATGKKILYLRSVASIAHLSQTQIFQMAQRMQCERFARDEMIITQGEAGEAFYLIQAGRAEVYIEDDCGTETGTPSSSRGSQRSGKRGSGDSAKRKRRESPTSATPRVALGKSEESRQRRQSFAIHTITDSHNDDDEVTKPPSPQMLDDELEHPPTDANPTEKNEQEQLERLRTKTTETDVRRDTLDSNAESVEEPKSPRKFVVPRASLLRNTHAKDLTSDDRSQGSSLGSYVAAVAARPSPVASGRRLMVRELGEGDYFGEIALFHDLPRTASVRASSSAVVVWSITRNEFKSIFCDDISTTTPLVVLGEPGDSHAGEGALSGDDELALVLMRALSDMKLVDLRAVVCSASPARARGQLARGTLDTLGLINAPVGIGHEAELDVLPEAGMSEDSAAHAATAPMRNTSDVGRNGAVGNPGGADNGASGVGEVDGAAVDREERDGSFAWAQLEDGAVAYAAEREPDYSDAQMLLEHTFIQAEDGSLALLALSPTSLLELARFIRENRARFVAKMARLIVLGSVEVDGNVLRPTNDINDGTAKGRGRQGAEYVFDQCQKLGVPLVVVSRDIGDAAPLPAFMYEELAAIGHPAAVRLRDAQMEAARRLWLRAAAPAATAEASAAMDEPVGTGHDGHDAQARTHLPSASRRGLPDHLDRAWFARTFCGGATALDGVPAGAAIWPHIQSLTTAAPLALLCVSPATLNRFFKPKIVVGKPLHGKGDKDVEHLVIGAKGEKDCIRESVALRSFLLDAFKYSLAASMDYAADQTQLRGSFG